MADKNKNLTAKDISVIAKLVLLVDSARNLAKTAQSDIDCLKAARAEGDMDYSQGTVILDDYRMRIAAEISAIRQIV
jgi:hypothetical protein